MIDYGGNDAIIVNNYYPFGMVMPGRKFSSGSTYRYGFNGQEKSMEINGTDNFATAQFWEYDSRIGRRWNVDFKSTVGESQYSVFRGNPIFHSDPLGDSSKSVHIDENGKVLLKKSDGDNSVYLHKPGSESEVKNYSEKDHSAGGQKIGELGKVIDATLITKNIVDYNKKVAATINLLGVLPAREEPGLH